MDLFGIRWHHPIDHNAVVIHGVHPGVLAHCLARVPWRSLLYDRGSGAPVHPRPASMTSGTLGSCHVLAPHRLKHLRFTHTSSTSHTSSYYISHRVMLHL